jgi:cell division septal protein FtsQ
VFDIKTKAVIIHGNNIITDKEVLELADMKDYPSFFTLKTRAIEKKLEKSPFIKEAELRRGLYFQIHLYITENKPLFIREDTNKIIFEDGKEENNEYDSLEIPSLINYVPNTKYPELIKKLNQINYNLLKRVSQIKYEPNKYDDARFILYMNDSNRVYINLPKFKSFNDYDKMVTKFEGKTGKLYLDSGNYFEIDK